MYMWSKNLQNVKCVLIPGEGGGKMYERCMTGEGGGQKGPRIGIKIFERSLKQSMVCRERCPIVSNVL